MIDDRLNQRIVACLRRNGRASNSEIAREVGLSEAAVRQRVKRLLDARVIRFRAVVNAAMLGIEVTYLIRAAIRPTRLEALARRLRILPPVAYISKTTGEYNALIAMAAPDEDFAELFIESWFANNPDILRYEFDRVRKVYKYDPDRSLITGVVDDFQSLDLPGDFFVKWREDTVMEKIENINDMEKANAVRIDL
ncbi:Lrp/AsnC family transcriptional regulator [Sphingobium sp. EM0848]|uniref:Lrp/AsnC family transcriptional regulator n=1 Tax=Sphingobium sp. EM0848 TaxID=2743473 RepID=UPI00159C0FF5|nr:Lrp/AsnC family transcriptional regulator [Sphingobium sp. EM0848]